VAVNARIRSLRHTATLCGCFAFFCAVPSRVLGGRSFGSDIGGLVAIGLQPLRNPLLAFLLDSPQQQTNQASQTKSQKLRNPLNDLLDEAQAAIDKNDFAAAIPPLQKFIAEKPDVAYAHFQLGYAYTNLQRPAEARPEYERSIAIDPKFFEAYLNLGTLLLETDPKNAIAPLRKAVELQAAQSHPRFLLAVALDRSGDDAAAAEQFQGVLNLDPNDFPSANYLGWYFLRHQKPADAEVKFRRALEIQPEDQNATLGLAQSLAAQKKPEAAEAYQQYISANPGDNETRTLLIRFLIDQKQYEAALAEINKTPDANPPTADTLTLRADLLVAQKKTDEAIASLQQALILRPQDAKLHGGLGRLYLGKRDFPNAEKELKIALQLDPQSLTYLKDLTSTFYLSGSYAMALAGLDATAKMETPGAGAWFIRALCYDKLRQVRPALDAYHKFLELDQDRNPDQVWQANQRIHVLEKMAKK
jgi:Flp pilus assembly protein TadD